VSEPGPKLSAVERAYRQSTRALGVLLSAIGVAMIVTTIAGGGAPLALGSVLGVMLVVLGAARAYLAGGHSRPRR